MPLCINAPLSSVHIAQMPQLMNNEPMPTFQHKKPRTCTEQNFQFNLTACDPQNPPLVLHHHPHDNRYVSPPHRWLYSSA